MSAPQIDALLKDNGIPIDGVSEIGENDYRIDFQSSATEEQRLHAQTIVDSFNVQAPVQRNWDGLAVAFKISQLNAVITQVKDEVENPSSQQNPIWRLSDDIRDIITIPVFSESDRVGGLMREFSTLFGKFKEGNIEITESVMTEFLNALRNNGFNDVADFLGGQGSNS